jgi:hypothetical protein
VPVYIVYQFTSIFYGNLYLLKRNAIWANNEPNQFEQSLRFDLMNDSLNLVHEPNEDNLN